MPPRASLVANAASPEEYPPPRLPEVAFAGRSNVGKSTLINALVGVRGLARTSQTPGKTRRIHFYEIDQRYCVVDLPGYGWAQVAQHERAAWRKIIETYLRQRENLACVVVLVDLRRGVGEQDQQLLAFLEAIEKPVLVVFTKADKLKGNERRNQIRRVADDIGWTVEELLVVSAEKNEGMDRLRAALAPYVG
jgi:GTP-binding protein